MREIDLVICGVIVPTTVTGVLPGTGAVVAVGRLVPKKGFDLLLEAVARVPGAERDLSVPVPSRKRCSALPTPSASPIRFLGATPHTETLAVIRGSDVLCLPARVAPSGDVDSMPVVVKEAMAFGVPVIATEVAGIPEMLDEQSGWLVPPDDVDALVAALSQALADPAEAQRRGVHAWQRARADLQLSSQVTVLVNVYRRLGMGLTADSPSVDSATR